MKRYNLVNINWPEFGGPSPMPSIPLKEYEGRLQRARKAMESRGLTHLFVYGDKEHFSNLKLPENPRQRILYDVPDHEETLISINTDREAPVTTVWIYHKTDAKVHETYGDYRNMLVE